MEKKWNVINTLFQKRDIHKFTWVSGVDGLKSLLDFVVVRLYYVVIKYFNSVLRFTAMGINQDDVWVQGSICVGQDLIRVPVTNVMLDYV